MPVLDEILEGEIVEQYRDVADTVPVVVAQDSDVNPCTSTGTCTQIGCNSTECRGSAGATNDCCTDDKKKKQYERRAVGWFDPPVAHG